MSEVIVRTPAETDEEVQDPHASTSSGEIFSQDREDRSTPHGARVEQGELEEESFGSEEERRQRKMYRGRTVAMLRRYMQYSIETGRLPSLLGREFFRTQVTSYTVVTFEDRVIFVHDMETCLGKLDEFSQQLIARHILQEHDRWATARLLGCNEKTVRRLTPSVLDLLSEILIDVGLLERVDGDMRTSCQGGKEGDIFVSDCYNGRNKF